MNNRRRPLLKGKHTVSTWADNYLTIQALEDDLTVSFGTARLQYSTDGEVWTILEAGQSTPAINAKQTISFKSSYTQTTVSIGTFTINKKFNLLGNCLSLISGDNASDTVDLTGYTNVFAGLFQNCKVVSVSKNFLPATTLSNGCYSDMFYNCVDLVQAPELSAKTLNSDCYANMFEGCVKLINAPKLPATTLAYSCYSAMFKNCTGMIKAPTLPATTLDSNCYEQMFAGCVNLTTAPALPATELSLACYYDMFSGCTSLKTAPELPATTLAVRCYRGMFYECSSLINIPALPATTLAKECYYAMFSGCTRLTTAPELAALTLIDSCYSNMFRNCINLNYIKMLATDVSADSCLNYWVYGVPSGGTFVKNNNATWTTTGINGVPDGWTIITE